MQPPAKAEESPPAAWALACLAVLAVAWGATGAAASDGPVDLWIGSLVVAPPHTPPLCVAVRNRQSEPYRAAVTIKVPPGWTFKPPQIDLLLSPGETARAVFTITKGTLDRENRYAIEASATGAGRTVTRRQEIVCASAPYFKPTIDGDPADWNDAIPVTFTDGGKRTTLSTFWDRRSFCILAAVEEQRLVGHRPDGPFDAVQLALSPEDAKTGDSPDGQAARFEFLLAADSSGRKARCYLLATPGMKLAQGRRERDLEPLAYDDAKVAVTRRGGVTYYECSIPFKLMRSQIRPSEGREFCLSLLVHDPDGTGLRDWGRAAGLWPSQRNPLAWSRWTGASWGEDPPLDNKTPWGLCSSKY